MALGSCGDGVGTMSSRASHRPSVGAAASHQALCPLTAVTQQPS